MTAATAAIVASSAESASGVPQLRTILLTDLVDSTGWVERLGDGPAAELFRAHDRLVLQLQERWRGRLIDRSDGMLLLFERPIDGLGFAIDYNRGLRELGEPHGAELTARAGLHVGEVLTWRNSDEAVRVGAKPLEIEGLAKPMAARLMTMARPGQILLSAVAEPLAHRAARELGERGQHLLWKSHGRWRFKGVPQPQQIFEVGEPGIAPLRAPPNSPKAWRDIPLWRRPAALAAEAAVVAVIAIGLWFFMRPQPAIAFNERDWVVLADLRNLTGEPLLDDSLEQAFRISLEQSRHVNVLSDLKTRDTLARMQREPDTELDRTIASEIAIRDGARAVILPTVAEVGGRVRVSAEVIDPHSQTTVYAEFVDGNGAQSVLASIDGVTGALRERLGEELDAVERYSEPLPRVTTNSLDALRAYALGHAAFAEGEWRKAIELYERAVFLDPEFALAHLARARVHVALSDPASALPHLESALSLKERLPPRDRLYLDAWDAQLRRPRDALAGWELLASMYPDYVAGQGNASWHYFVLNDFEKAHQFALGANIQQSPLRAIGFDQLGRIELARGRTSEAKVYFERANALSQGVSFRQLAAAQAVEGNYEKARETVTSMGQSGFATDDPVRYIDLVTFASDQGNWPEAYARLEEVQQALEPESLLAREFDLIGESVNLIAKPDGYKELRIAALVDRQLAVLARPSNAEATDDAFMALVAAYLGQRAGFSAPARKAVSALEDKDGFFDGTVVDKMLAIVRAEQERLAGRPADAIQILEDEIDGTELVQARVAMAAALADAGRPGAALEHLDWVIQHRGRAYMEANASQVLQTLNVIDTRFAQLKAAEMLVAAKEPGPAIERVRLLSKDWPRNHMPGYLRRRMDEIFPASKQ